jgi:hypothetical protein
MNVACAAYDTFLTLPQHVGTNDNVNNALIVVGDCPDDASGSRNLAYSALHFILQLKKYLKTPFSQVLLLSDE